MEVQARQPPAKGPADWFTGDVYVDPIAQAHGSAVTIGAVHFTPCAHTAWHRHTVGQTLYVTEGEGRVQSRGGPVITIRPVAPPSVSGLKFRCSGDSSATQNSADPTARRATTEPPSPSIRNTSVAPNAAL